MASPFSILMTERVTLVKRNGTRVKNIPASVQPGLILTDSSKIPIEDGDHFERAVPGGRGEIYEVVDAGFTAGILGIPAHYASRVNKVSALPEQSSSGRLPDGRFLETFSEALLEAFPRRSELAQLLFYGFEVDIATITSEGPLTETVFEIVKWAKEKARLDELLAAAHKRNPTAAKLSELAKGRLGTRSSESYS